MNNSFFLAAYMNMFGSKKSLIFKFLSNVFVEKLNGNLWGFNEVKWFHDNNIQQTIAHRCLRSDIGIVTIL